MRQVFSLSAHQNAAAFLFIFAARITDSSSASSLIFAACPSSRLITVSRAILLALIGSDGERLAADRADAVVCRPNSMIGVPPLVVAVSTAKSFLFPVWIHLDWSAARQAENACVRFCVCILFAAAYCFNGPNRNTKLLRNRCIRFSVFPHCENRSFFHIRHRKTTSLHFLVVENGKN